MSVTVYPRLGELLREKDVTAMDVARQIEERFGLRVSRRTLERLTQTTPIRHADLELAGAVASVLGVELSDIFTVEATPIIDRADDDILDPAQSRRLQELYDQQGQRLLTDDEWEELEELVAAYGQRLHRQRMRELAQRRGIPLEQAERDAAVDLAGALDWWREVQADPARLQALVTESRRSDASAISESEAYVRSP
jgi:hypothetical protein